MNYQKLELNFKTYYDYFKKEQKEQVFAKINKTYIKVNAIYEKNTPFFPIRVSKDKVEYVSKHDIFKSIKEEENGVISITPEMSMEDRFEARRKNRNKYQREYQREYVKKKQIIERQLGSVTLPLPNPKQISVHPIAWFRERIGYIVYRDKSTCKCDDCVRLLEQGWAIMDENDCLRLYNEQIKYKIRFDDRLDNQAISQ